MVDFLIIRSKADTATEYTNWVGEGLKAYLEGKGYTVTDLSDADASPDKVSDWLKINNMKVTKAVIALDHGGNNEFYGELNGQITPVIDVGNVEDLAKKLQVYTMACSTNADNGLGQTAVAKGCFSWLGYKEPVYAAKSQAFKDCVWSYITAMAEGKTMEECESALRSAYQAHNNDSFIYGYNLQRLLLRKSQGGMTINTFNRISQPGAGYATRIDLDYILGNPTHCFWAIVDNKAYARWVNDDEVKSIVHPAFKATKVWIEHDGASKITRIRPIDIPA